MPGAGPLPTTLLALALGSLRSRSVELEDNSIIWSNECVRFFGIPAEMTREVRFSRVHPADVAQVRRVAPEVIATGREAARLPGLACSIRRRN